MADRQLILLMQVPVPVGMVMWHHQLAGMVLHQVLQVEPDHELHYMHESH